MNEDLKNNMNEDLKNNMNGQENSVIGNQELPKVEPQEEVAPITQIEDTPQEILTETPVEPQVNVTPIEQPMFENNVLPAEEPKKKSPVALIVVIAILVILGVAVFFLKDNLFGTAYKLVSQKSTAYLKNAINEVYSAIDFTKPLLESGDFSISTDVEDYKFIDGYKIDYELGLDVENNQTLFGLNLNKNDKKLLGLDGISKDDKIYIKSPDLLSNIYYVAGKIDLSKSVEEADLIYLSNVFERALNETLKEDYKTSKETITINGNEVKVTDTYYELDKEGYTKLASRGIDVFLKDSKTIKILAELSNKTEEEIKKSLEEGKKADFEGTVRLDIYTKGLIKQLVGIKIIDKESTAECSFDKDYYNFIIISGNEKTTIEIKNGDINFMYDNEEQTYTGKVTKVTNNEYKYEFNLIDSTINGTINNKTEGKTQTCNLIFNLEMGTGGKVTVTANSKIEQDAKIEFFDTSSSLDFNSMTEKDSEKMLSKIFEIMEETGLSSMLGGLMISE